MPCPCPAYEMNQNWLWALETIRIESRHRTIASRHWMTKTLRGVVTSWFDIMPIIRKENDDYWRAVDHFSLTVFAKVTDAWLEWAHNSVLKRYVRSP